MTEAGTTPKDAFPEANPLKKSRRASKTARPSPPVTGPRPRGADEEITAKLNEVLANEPDRPDTVFFGIQAESIGREDW